MRGLVVLERECEVTLIPSGERVKVPAGTDLRVVQTLGGHVTVQSISDGQLLRIDAKDAALLGEEFAAQAEAVPAAGGAEEGPFDEARVWEQLRTVYDPEIPVNIVELGLVYQCQAAPLPEGGQRVDIQMTVTAPGCGMGPVLQDDVRRKVLGVPGVKEASVELVFDPPWDQSRMSEVARLELGWM
ncbi:putative Fe-S cluster assembly protein SufT [Stigmatella sp. ncwal1]|uniref:Fe-S cluster assembly protein SufT n=1 Tax=Stigmatella ashevillensis TaxID=2995309 RepID=A0ABT5DIQ8_9BACT|nr:putative Fe-S cluster assembly protein SufT [Stigmatella ashevillena]MDC0713547.1 putative Fe-S cluster assembly protein SufT [Stigmatella ashevillena]